MRIIGGSLKGRSILPPKSFMARPTTDFAKEGLFNTLTNLFNFEEIAVLDLFAGTGSITYEFASRGCTKITTVEMNTNHHLFIKGVVSKLELKGINLLKLNVFDFLDICKIKYDLVFADPPYDIQGLEGIPDKILSKNILNEGALLIFEHPAAHNFSKHPNFIKEKKYGNVHFSLFSKDKNFADQKK